MANEAISSHAVVSSVTKTASVWDMLLLFLSTLHTLKIGRRFKWSMNHIPVWY
jgi:hypothetical protein